MQRRTFDFSGYRNKYACAVVEKSSTEPRVCVNANVSCSAREGSFRVVMIMGFACIISAAIESSRDAGSGIPCEVVGLLVAELLVEPSPLNPVSDRPHQSERRVGKCSSFRHMIAFTSSYPSFAPSLLRSRGAWLPSGRLTLRGRPIAAFTAYPAVQLVEFIACEREGPGAAGVDGGHVRPPVVVALPAVRAPMREAVLPGQCGAAGVPALLPPAVQDADEGICARGGADGAGAEGVQGAAGGDGEDAAAGVGC